MHTQTFTDNPVRIVIADDHEILIDGFCFAIRKCKDLHIVGKALDGEMVLQVMEAERPHIVFIDIQMLKKNGIEATKEIKKRFPDVKVIAFTGFADDCYITDMMIEAGASGYLLKEDSKKILEAIKAVMNNDVYCSEEVSKKLVRLLQETQTNPLKPFNKPVFTDIELLVKKLQWAERKANCT